MDAWKESLKNMKLIKYEEIKKSVIDNQLRPIKINDKSDNKTKDKKLYEW